MKRKRCTKFVVLCSLILFSLIGCDKYTAESISDSSSVEDSLTTNTPSDEAQRVNIDFQSLLYFVTLVDNGIIYAKTEGNNLIYYIQNDDNTPQKIGQIDNFFLSMKQSVLAGDNIYFYLSTYDDYNTLVCINMNTFQIEQFSHKDASVPGLMTYLYNDDIVTFKNIVTEKETKTYIEVFDTENKQWSAHMECSVDNYTGRGEAVYGVCSNSQYLYVLHDIRENKKEFESYLEILDKEYNIIRSVEIDKSMHDFVLTSFISDMQAFENYIYIYNASDYGYLARLSDKGMEEVFKGRDFNIATDSSMSSPIFFTRRSNSVFYLNSDGTLKEVILQVKNDYTIQTMLCDEDSCFVVFYLDDAPSFAYVVEKAQLEETVFPCA